MQRRVVFWGAVLVVGAGLIVAAAQAGPAQRKGGTLRIAGTHDLDSLDPALALLTDSAMLQYVVCAKLYSYPDKPAPEGARLIPEVAADFPTSSKDGKTQTIALKQTYRFYNGAKITAANFVAALNRVASPKLQAPAVGGGFLDDIVGARAVIDGKAQTISGVRAPGPYVLQIRTTRPVRDLPARLSLPYSCPIPVGTPLQPMDAPLGSGPYYVASHTPNRQLTLRRNPFYRGPRPANVDRIVWTVGMEPEACRQAVERNELDWCSYTPVADYREIAAEHGVNRPDGQFFVNPELSLFYLSFNHDRPAFHGTGQIPLKQAINWALDRHELARVSGYLTGKRTDQILPDAMARKAKIYPLDGVDGHSLAKARALYARAKLKPDKLVLYSTTGFLGVNPIWAGIIQYDLKRLGIDVEVKYMSTVELYRRLGTRGEPFDFAIDGWVADYADGADFFQPLLNGEKLGASGNWNHAYFDRPKYNREIDRIDRLAGKAREDAWADLDVEMMRDDPPWAPFMELASRDFVSSSFGCFTFQPVIDMIDLPAACKR